MAKFIVDLGVTPCVDHGVRIKPSEALRFLAGLAVAVLLLGFLVLRVTSCAPAPPLPPAPGSPSAPGAHVGRLELSPPPPAIPPAEASGGCRATGWDAAAAANSASLRTLAWAPFRRPEIGWETYAPLIAREIGTACGPETQAFAAAFAAWQVRQRLPADGMMSDAGFTRLKGVMEGRRPFVLLNAQGICPPGADEAGLELSRPGEGYGGMHIPLRPATWVAYRAMVAAAKAEDPRIAADPNNLTLFSGYRSPDATAARCAAEGGCNSMARANCSAHRTGLAVDIYVGQAPGFRPDSSADPNRLHMTQQPTYRWLLANASRFGFVPYPFEPWHWEWTGEAP
ncbi:MAG: D-alanyl-D-alanine carboxypeptidase family protein [Phenylobacterium sp.]